jgi:hypothetical protein
MRLYSFSILSTLFLGLAACPKGGAEDCSDNADNDGDAAVDCDDSECATDPACDEEEETDTEEPPPEEEDCLDVDWEDEDEDEFSNCADSDCFGIPECDEAQLFVWKADLTVDGTTSATGDGTAGWERWDIPNGLVADVESFITPDQSDCHITFDIAGTPHASAADCTDCTWAFDLAYSNSSEQTGADCTGYNDLHDPEDGSAYNVDGQVYGFGYNPVYETSSGTLPVMMYFNTEDGAWVGYTADVTNTGSDFSFAVPFSYPYYY